MTDWWPAAASNPHASLRLLCLPYAGGRAATFRAWPAGLKKDVEVRALALPGRAERIAEPPIDDVTRAVVAIADAAEPLLDRSWAAFGHSMGAVLAFELVRELRRRGHPPPVLLAVAGQDAPPRVMSGGTIHRLSDHELAKELRRLSGTPTEVLEDADVMAVLLPALRADFRICETYACADERPLDSRLLVLDAVGDPETTAEGIAAWGRTTTAETKTVMLPGRHFFLHSAERPVLQAIGRALVDDVECDDS